MNKREEFIEELLVHARGELGLRKPARHLRYCYLTISQLHQRDDVGWAEIAELFNEARRRAGATSSVRHQILCRLFHLESERRSGTRSGSRPTSAGAVDDRNWLNAEVGAPGSEVFGRSREDVRQHRVRDGPPVTPSNETQTGADDIRALMERDRRLRNLKKRE